MHRASFCISKWPWLTSLNTQRSAQYISDLRRGEAKQRKEQPRGKQKLFISNEGTHATPYETTYM